jgi:aspartate-semialdehyde dehydrogenase
MKQYNVAVVGATGVVGRKMLKVLEERKIPVANLYPMASERSAGKKVTFQGKEWTVEKLTPESLTGYRFCAVFRGRRTSLEFSPIASIQRRGGNRQ